MSCLYTKNHFVKSRIRFDKWWLQIFFTLTWIICDENLKVSESKLFWFLSLKWKKITCSKNMKTLNSTKKKIATAKIGMHFGVEISINECKYESEYKTLWI